LANGRRVSGERAAEAGMAHLTIESVVASEINRPDVHQRPNRWRVIGELRAEGDERVRCTRVLARS